MKNKDADDIYKRMFYEFAIYGRTTGPTEEEREKMRLELEAQVKKMIINQILKEI